MSSDMNIKPKVIFDVGSCVQHFYRHAKRIWRDADIYCFDAFSYLKPLYDKTNVNFDNVLLYSDDDCKIKFYENPFFYGGNSIYREQTTYFPDTEYKIMQTITLDTLIKLKGYPYPDLIKIDTQNLNISNSSPINLRYNVDNIVPYGVLKGGFKPTMREWNKTQKNRDNIILTDTSNTSNIINNERETRLNILKEKIKEKQKQQQHQQIQTVPLQLPIVQKFEEIREIDGGNSGGNSEDKNHHNECEQIDNNISINNPDNNIIKQICKKT
jgi:hypothetical protein